MVVMIVMIAMILVVVMGLMVSMIVMPVSSTCHVISSSSSYHLFSNAIVHVSISIFDVLAARVGAVLVKDHRIVSTGDV